MEVINKVLDFAASLGFGILNLEFSPIKGPEGNIEYLARLQNNPEQYGRGEAAVDPQAVVEQAHKTL